MSRAWQASIVVLIHGGLGALILSALACFLCPEEFKAYTDHFLKSQPQRCDLNPVLAHARLRHGGWLQRGRDFMQLPLEYEGWEVPMFSLQPGGIQLQEPLRGYHSSAQKVDEVPGAWLLLNVLSPDECDLLVLATESMGYSDGRGTRKEARSTPRSQCSSSDSTTHCVTLLDGSLNDGFFRRISASLPVGSDHMPAVGLNARWRFYKSSRGQGLAPHIDRSHLSTSAGAKNGLPQDLVEDRKSRFSLILYLSDGFEGGRTTFTLKSGRRHAVEVPRGGAIIFPHGESPLSLVHEGGVVLSGTKYIARTDVLFPLESADQCREEASSHDFHQPS